MLWPIDTANILGSIEAACTTAGATIHNSGSPLIVQFGSGVTKFTKPICMSVTYKQVVVQVGDEVSGTSLTNAKQIKGASTYGSSITMQNGSIVITPDVFALIDYAIYASYHYYATVLLAANATGNLLALGAHNGGGSSYPNSSASWYADDWSTQLTALSISPNEPLMSDANTYYEYDMILRRNDNLRRTNPPVGVRALMKPRTTGAVAIAIGDDVIWPGGSVGWGADLRIINGVL